ncbi:hypothetical protein MBLNU13_g00939t1 [Cladosporium sp. NU13]
MALTIPDTPPTDKTEMHPAHASHVIAPIAQLHPTLTLLIRTDLPLPPSLQPPERPFLKLAVPPRITLMLNRRLRPSNVSPPPTPDHFPTNFPHGCGRLGGSARSEEVWAKEVGVAGCGERAAGPGSWVGGFVGESEDEEVAEARVAEGVGVY